MHGHSTLFSNVKSLIFQWKYFTNKDNWKGQNAYNQFQCKTTFGNWHLLSFRFLKIRIKTQVSSPLLIISKSWFDEILKWSWHVSILSFLKIAFRLKINLIPFAVKLATLFPTLKNNATSKTSLRKIFSFSLRMYVIV